MIKAPLVDQGLRTRDLFGLYMQFGQVYGTNLKGRSDQAVTISLRASCSGGL